MDDALLRRTDREADIFRAIQNGWRPGGSKGSSAGLGVAALSNGAAAHYPGDDLADILADTINGAAVVATTAPPAAYDRQASAVADAASDLYWSAAVGLGREALGIALARFIVTNKREIYVWAFCLSFAAVTYWF